MSRLDDILLLEKAGRLPPEMQADLDTLRAAGRVPPLEQQVSPMREAAATAVEIGTPILGGIAAAPAGPLGALAGSAVGGGAGRYLAEKIRGREATGREILASTAVAAIPGGAAAKATKAGAGLLKRAAAYAAEGAVIGGAGTATDIAIEEGRLPTVREVAKGAGAGALIGGALGGTFGKRPAKATPVAAPPVVRLDSVAGVKTGSPFMMRSYRADDPSAQLPGRGTFFAASKKHAQFYSQGRPIITADVTLENPMVFDGLQNVAALDLLDTALTNTEREALEQGLKDVDFLQLDKTIKSIAQRRGHDGIVFKTDPAERSEIVVFGSSAARKVNDDAARATAVVAETEAGVTPAVAPEPPPAGERRIILPGEAPPPDSGEPVQLFGPDGKVLPAAAPVLEKRMSIPLADTLQADILKNAEEATAALQKLSPEVKKQRFFRQLNTAVKDGLFNPSETVAVLHKNGWTMQQFFAEEVAGTLSKFESDVSGAGKILNRLSVEKKRILATLAADPETRKIVDDLAVAAGVDNPLWRLWQEVIDLDDVSRAMAIGQMATAHRNAVSQAGRLTLEIPVDALRRVFEGMGMGAERPAGNPLATLVGMASSLRPGNTERVLALLQGIGPEGEVMARRLFGTNLSETAFIAGSRTGRPIRGLFSRMRRTSAEGRSERRLVKATLGPVADAATAYTALQENFFRRAAFQARLMQHAQRKGIAWAKVQQSPGLLSAEDFEDSLGHALRITFSAEPEGRFGRNFVQFIRKGQPFTTQFVAYPRYLANFGKFFLDFNPVGMLRLFSPAARKEKGAKIAAEALIGTALLGAGTALRLSDRAGERWYELTGDDGERKNAIGLAGPFLPYVFLGELVARQLREKPTPRPISPEDYTQGLVGLRLSPGTTAIFDMLKDRKDVPEALDQIVGEWLGRFTVPLRTIKDFAAAFGNESERLYLDPRDVLELPGDRRTRLLNPTIQNVPEAGEKLRRPAAVSAVTGQKKASEKTALRQLTGVTTRTPTDLGIELDRLGVDEYKLLQPTGIPRVDRALARRAGTLAQAVAPGILSDPGYQAMGPAMQTVVWGKVYKKLAKAAREHLKKTNPSLAGAMKLKKKYSEAEQAMLLEQGIDIPKLTRELASGSPEE